MATTAEPVSDALLWVSLSLIPGLGGAAYRALLSAFGSPDVIYRTSTQSLLQVVSQDVAACVARGPDENALLPVKNWLSLSGNGILTLADENYPQCLLQLPDPPPMLYTKGDVSLLNRPTVGIVGSRHATPQGLKNAEAFAHALSDAGWCISSGMAAGIDGAAHWGALKGSGSTIAVVGTGLDIVYPARHRSLAHQISEQGLLISEFPLGTPSKASNFPRRNRIISGLAQGVLVVEANLESGSLITARLAAEQGREVFAIPGSIHSPQSRGCHLLIKQGAKLVDSINDILEELGGAPISQVSREKADDELHPLLEVMGYDAISVDTLIQNSGLTSEQVSAMLLTLELEGKIATLPGGHYQRLE